MKHSLRSLEGYLLIDNRNSPGLTETILEPGQSPENVPLVGAGASYESATITCSHCQTVVVLNPMRTRARGYCAKCDHYICDNPLCSLDCLPLNKVLDDLQERILKNGSLVSLV